MLNSCILHSTNILCYHLYCATSYGQRYKSDAFHIQRKTSQLSLHYFFFVSQKKLGSTRFWKQSSESRRLLVFKCSGLSRKALCVILENYFKTLYNPQTIQLFIGVVMDSLSHVVLGTIMEDSMDHAIIPKPQLYCIHDYHDERRISCQ